MAYLSSPDRHITVKDMECLKEAFALFDRDRDGEINTDELGKVRDFQIQEIWSENFTLQGFCDFSSLCQVSIALLD